MKKIFSICLLSILAVNAWSYDFKVGKLCYNLINGGKNNTVEVTYQKYRAKDNYAGLTKVEIPATVTYKGVNYAVTDIGEYAFFDCISLKEVTIPSAITNIGGWAFTGTTLFDDPAYWSNDLLIVDGCLIRANELLSGNYIVRDSIRVVADRAFADCQALNSVILNEGVQHVGKEAFSKCFYLRGVAFPKSVKSVGSRAFWGCTQLIGVQFLDGLLSIGEKLFEGCTSLKVVIIPATLDRISRGCFIGCSKLQDFVIPQSVQYVGERVFDGCTSITSLIIPNGVPALGYKIFAGCTAMTSLVIPRTVTSIGQNAFMDCTALTDMIFQGTKEEWKAIYKDPTWDINMNCKIVHCTDGDLAL